MPSIVELRRAVTETLWVLRKASEQWAAHSCPGSSECCQLSTTKLEPWLWPTEWEVVLDELKKQNRPLPSPRADGGCPLLDPTGRRCTVYEARPFGCRTFFCHRITGPAKQPVTRTNELLERLSAINVSLDAASNPRSISLWFAAAKPSPSLKPEHDAGARARD